MAYVGPTVPARVPSCAASKKVAQGFVHRLVMQTSTNIIMANWSRMMWQCIKQSGSNVEITGKTTTQALNAPYPSKQQS
ncbi:hypothetical protein KIN20_005122 [Parelaphostrongylus tenuis]|uniref:Uncharacterized protein n=1 Tax=Parelaphostrongylus tenuis TaxID=148309 RepID=A0AAD5M427_PARTN|nr:hypothetical protein KIN20_005122 [Parelaphostrongylus tenuis]